MKNKIPAAVMEDCKRQMLEPMFGKRNRLILLLAALDKAVLQFVHLFSPPAGFFAVNFSL